MRSFIAEAAVGNAQPPGAVFWSVEMFFGFANRASL
jgi:hypothetical protein